MAQSNCKQLICVIGPTGAGKSAFAMDIAESLDGEIVNCDSLQIYKGFNIGTAKVPLRERRGIPHYLIDVVHPSETFTAGDYARHARAVIAEISARGKTPVVAGGTGFYLRALLDGLSPLPESDPELRIRLGRKPARLHGLLRRLDAASAARIHANDTPKLMRALEIRIRTGRAASAHGPPDPLTGYQVRKIGLFPPRATLYQRINDRCRWMFSNGFVEEVRGLLADGIPETAKPFESIGYRQVLACLRGELDLSSALAQTQQATRNYAKRQVTWFRREPGMEIAP